MTPYKNYWQRKDLLGKGCPHFSVVKHWDSESLSPVEKLIFDKIGGAKNLLDFGAGDLRVKKKMVAEGFKGIYKTLDHGEEYSYDFRSLDQVDEKFDGILFLDVIEHLNLAEGLELMISLLGKLNDYGYLILQTPNGRCIRNQKATDMTHLHIYNLKDLWAFCSAMGYKAEGWRVDWTIPNPSVPQSFRLKLSSYVTSRILGADYTDNILLIVQKSAM